MQVNKLKNTYSNVERLISFLFVTIVIFSNSIFVITDSSSLRTSMIFSASFSIIAGFVMYKRKVLRWNLTCILKITLMIIIVILNFILSTLIYDSHDYDRFILSLFLLISVIFIAGIFRNIISSINDNRFHKTVIFMLNLMISIGIISIFLRIFNASDGRSMILFREPSHYSIVLLPLLLYRMATSANEKNKLIYLCLTMIIAYFIQNLTLVAGTLMIFIFTYWKNKKLLLAIIFLSLFTLLIFGERLELSYFVSRLMITRHTNNLSVLVLLSGYERAILSIKDTYGIGLGFQQLGYVGSDGFYVASIQNILNGQSLNLYDGGALGAKIIAELGIFGIFLVCAYVYYYIKVAKRMIRYRDTNPKSTFYASIYLMFSIQVFIRGIGYFSPSSFVFLASLYSLNELNSIKRLKKHLPTILAKNIDDIV